MKETLCNKCGCIGSDWCMSCSLVAPEEYLKIQSDYFHKGNLSERIAETTDKKIGSPIFTSSMSLANIGNKKALLD